MFSNDYNIESTDKRNLGINLAIDNTNILDRYKNFKAMKINEIKPTLNAGLKASKRLQLI